MGYQFVSSDVKFGISLDRKSFCVITKDGVDFYSDVDEFLAMWKSLILRMIDNHKYIEQRRNKTKIDEIDE